MSEPLTDEAMMDILHRERHVELHKMLDELLADYIMHSKKLLSETSCLELMQWSHQQTIDPTP